MNDIQVNDALQVTVAGFGVIGALTATTVIVGWMKQLLRLRDTGVMWLTTAVALFVVLTVMASQVDSRVTYAFIAVYGTCFVAAAADAFFHQQANGVRVRAGHLPIDDTDTEPDATSASPPQADESL